MAAIGSEISGWEGGGAGAYVIVAATTRMDGIHGCMYPRHGPESDEVNWQAPSRSRIRYFCIVTYSAAVFLQHVGL